MKKHSGMRPQDIVILLAILAKSKDDSFPLNNKDIAKSLRMSESEISESLYRSKYAGLIADIKLKKINSKALLDFLIYGIKYAFPTQPSAVGRGIPTAQSANPLKNMIVSEDAFVWEFAEGKVRGQIIEPLYPTVPAIVQNNSNLYELLALVDAIRIGTARTVSIASTELEKRILSTLW